MHMTLKYLIDACFPYYTNSIARYIQLANLLALIIHKRNGIRQNIRKYFPTYKYNFRWYLSRCKSCSAIIATLNIETQRVTVCKDNWRRPNERVTKSTTDTWATNSMKLINEWHPQCINNFMTNNAHYLKIKSIQCELPKIFMYVK